MVGILKKALFLFFVFLQSVLFLFSQGYYGNFTFGDTNLEYVVNKQLPVKGKLSSLQHLIGDSSGIESYLKGLEFCTNLEYASLSDNRIYGISPLRADKKLKYLDLSFNLLSQIDTLKYLKRLRYLNLASNEIKDISALSALKNLVYLDISSNQIKSLLPLKNLKKLKYLNVSMNPLSEKELQVLSKFSELEYLDISGIKCHDFSFLKKLIHLKRLKMQFLDLISLPPELKKLPLIYVDLGYNKLKEVKNLPSTVEKLYLDFNQIENVSYFPEIFPHLKFLNISYNKIKDLTPLLKMHLKEMITTGNPASSQSTSEK
jgi:Leucine-rich repeat (LRR) protein